MQCVRKLAECINSMINLSYTILMMFIINMIELDYTYLTFKRLNLLLLILLPLLLLLLLLRLLRMIACNWRAITWWGCQILWSDSIILTAWIPFHIWSFDPWFWLIAEMDILTVKVTLFTRSFIIWICWIKFWKWIWRRHTDTSLLETRNIVLYYLAIK